MEAHLEEAREADEPREEGLGELEEETFKLFPGDHICPYVTLEVEGLDTDFLVDTGNVNTVVSFAQVAKWGLTKWITKRKKQRFIEASIRMRNIDVVWRFEVSDVI